jgi:putative endonuclease
MAKGGFVYIMTNKSHSTLYTGVTSEIIYRVREHRDKLYPNSFTARYKCNKLVYYHFFDDIESAIVEEKRIKGGSRKGKIKLIEFINPEWNDLFDEIEDW